MKNNLKEIEECMFSTHNFDKGLILGAETLRIMRNVYGKVHPIVSHHMMKVYTLITISNYVDEENVDFLNKTICGRVSYKSGRSYDEKFLMIFYFLCCNEVLKNGEKMSRKGRGERERK